MEGLSELTFVVFIAVISFSVASDFVWAHIATNPASGADWHWRPEILLPLVFLGGVHARGWLRLRSVNLDAVRPSHLALYLLGLSAICVALLSPIDALASILLSMHMVQHLLLLMIAPLCILLADPLAALLWGLPRRIRYGIGRLLARGSLFRHFLWASTLMPVTWSLYVITLWAWHHPALYQAALKNEWVHDLQHLLFFFTAILFWSPIVVPAPRLHGSISYGFRIAYLVAATLQNTLLGFAISFPERVLYPFYTTVPELRSLAPIDDQALGGGIMWVSGHMYLIPILVLVYRLLVCEEEALHGHPTNRLLSRITGLKVKSLLFLVIVIFSLWPSSVVFGNDVAEHVDPELLTGWRIWLHLTIQWIHLVAVSLWLGLIVGMLVLKLDPRLDLLLYGSWVIFLVILATGSYNMEWSAGISEMPSVLLLTLLDRIPYGVSYTLALAGKLIIYVLIVFLTLVITALHLKHQVSPPKLQKVFLLAGSFLGIAITLMAAVVLFYHEVADLWPTPVHSLGGVMTPTGPLAKSFVGPESPPPNDFNLLATNDAWIDIVFRSIHLLGFGLLLGGMVIAAFFKEASMKRFLWYAWILLVIQLVSGIGNMARWTPFHPAPYLWNLSSLAHMRFGWSYTIFMAAKQALVVGIIGLLVALTYRSVRLSYWKQGQSTTIYPRPYFMLAAALAFTIAYVTIIILFLHEGVDHAL